MIKEADRLLGEAIRTIAALYKDGILQKPKTYAYAFPDLLAFHDAPTVIEQELFVMYLEHRMRAFQGTFHAHPDYAAAALERLEHPKGIGEPARDWTHGTRRTRSAMKGDDVRTRGAVLAKPHGDRT